MTSYSSSTPLIDSATSFYRASLENTFPGSTSSLRPRCTEPHRSDRRVSYKPQAIAARVAQSTGGSKGGRTTHSVLALCVGRLSWDVDIDDDSTGGGGGGAAKGGAGGGAGSARTKSASMAAVNAAHAIKIYAWRCPRAMAETLPKAIERIGQATQQLINAAVRLRTQPQPMPGTADPFCRLCLNSSPEEVREALRSTRRAAEAGSKVLFYYSSHGMPRMDRNVIHLQGKSGTAPFPVDELLQHLGSPAIMVLEGANSGAIVDYLARQHAKAALSANGPHQQHGGHHHSSHRGGAGGADIRGDPRGNVGSSGGVSSSAGVGGGAGAAGSAERYVLASCSEGESPSVHPHLPNDLFTCCLVTPVKAALLWYIIDRNNHALEDDTTVDGRA